MMMKKKLRMLKMVLPALLTVFLWNISAWAQSEISIEQGAEVAIPILSDPDTEIEALDIIIKFDEAVIDATGFTLADEILEDEAYNYELNVNTDYDDKITIIVSAWSELYAGEQIGTVNFKAVGAIGTSSALSFRKFRCNEGEASDQFGFGADDAVWKTLTVVISPPNPGNIDLVNLIAALKILAGMDLGTYYIDVTGDDKTGMDDAILILRILAGIAEAPSETAIETAQSDKPRNTSPAVSETDLQALVSGNTNFAFDLYQELSATDGNLFFSPHSISLALAMTYAGARNNTEQQMTDTLHFLSQDALHPALNALDLELAERGQGAEGTDGEGFKLNIANALWGQTGYPFLDTFLDVLSENYGAGMNLLDFNTAPDESRIIINDWVSDQTEEKIKDLIPQGAISSLTRLVLTNAIYFNAAWKYPFEEEATQDGTFNLSDGGQVTVPMMSQTSRFGYAAGDGYQAAELLYDGDELSMVILVPDAGTLGSFEDSLTSESLDTILSGLEIKDVNLQLPKFKYESDSVSLKDMLAKMGMPDAFGADADFSGIDGNKNLFISDVIHKAFVSVDEAGTEAAAATAVIMDESAPGEIIPLTIDRPFIFLIRDIATKAVLFAGRITNPAE
jgi:serpin B